MRTEPPVSLPSAKSQAPAAVAAAEPLDDPPGIRPGARTLAGVPEWQLMPVTLKHNSSQMVLPVLVGPARIGAVMSCGTKKPSRGPSLGCIGEAHGVKHEGTENVGRKRNRQIPMQCRFHLL